MKMIDAGKTKEYIESHRDMFDGDWNFIVDFFSKVVASVPEIEADGVLVQCQYCHRRWHDGYCPVMKKEVPDKGYCHEGKI